MTRRRSLRIFATLLLLIPVTAHTAVTTVKQEKAPQPSTASVTRQFTLESQISGGVPVSMTIVALSSEEGAAKAAMSQAVSRISSFSSELFSSGGVEEKINALKMGESLPLSDENFGFLSRVLDLCALTNGWFDIASSAQKSMILQRDWRRIRLNRETKSISFKSNGVGVDLKRIAQGYATDLALGEIQKAGFANALVRIGSAERNIGRDIFTPWSFQIGFGNRGDKLARRALNYSLSNVAATTVTSHDLGSGLMDPHSKQLASGNGSQSITVIAADASTSTAYALAAFVLGAKNGLKFVLSHPESKGIMVDSDGNLVASAGFGNASSTAAIESQRKSASDGGPNDLRQKENEERSDQ